MHYIYTYYNIYAYTDGLCTINMVYRYIHAVTEVVIVVTGGTGRSPCVYII